MTAPGMGPFQDHGSPVRRPPSSPGLAEREQTMELVRKWEHEEVDADNYQSVSAEVHKEAESGFAAIAKIGMVSRLLAGKDSSSPATRWMRAAVKASAGGAARKLREAARLKALQRTPYPMVLARIKLLLDRLHVYKQPMLSGSMGSHYSSNGARSMSPTKMRMQKEPSLITVPSRTTSFRVPNPGEEGQLASPFSTGAAGGPMDDGSGVSRLSFDKLMEELGVTFAYVSEFLRKVPDETRMTSIMHVKMENYKKDQSVYRIGDSPEKFYIILTGQVEVWTHPPGYPRERTIIASLKKGQSFGDHAILNNEPRSECATPTSNCTFLTVEKGPFVEIFGGYFQAKLNLAQNFLCNNVDMFKKVSPSEGMAVVRHMMLSTYHGGREWEPYNEPQLYFIKEGMCSLESHDRKMPQSDTVSRAMLSLQEDMGDEEEPGVAGSSMPVLAESGILSNVVLRNGRAMGTLGHEEEMRRLRRQLIPKRTIATLGPGSHFGGGRRVLGDGELQSSLRVLAGTDLEVYHLHVDTFFAHASPALVAALRDDVSFRLTYYYGRIGTISSDQVVGHGDSLLATTVHKQDVGTDGGGSNAQSMPGNTAVAGSGKGMARRRKAQKHAHEPGRYNLEVESAITYIKDLQAHHITCAAGTMDTMAKARLVGPGAAQGILPVPGYMEYLTSQGATPAERFWSTPAVSATARSNAVAPLLSQVFPEGLAPLSEKLEELIDRSLRVVDQAPAAGTSPRTSRSPAAGGRAASPLHSPGARSQAELLRRLAQSRPATAPADNDSGGGYSGSYGGAFQSATASASQSAFAPAAGHAWGHAPPAAGSRPASRGGLGASFPPPSPRAGRVTPSPLHIPGSLAKGGAAAAEGGWSPSGRASPKPAGAPYNLPSAFQAPGSPGQQGSGSPAAGYQTLRSVRPGALPAASVLWERTQELTHAPALRQCLTFEEIAVAKKR